MAQISTTTSTPGGYTIATMQAAVNALSVAMQSGKIIYASDVQAINSSVYNLWRNHTHTASDLQGKDTFGNITVYGVSGFIVGQTTSATSPVYTAATTPAGIAADQVITAADINTMIGIVNNMRVHSHTIFDGVGLTGPIVSISPTTSANTGYGGATTTTLTFFNDGSLTDALGVVGEQWINMNPVDAATVAEYQIFCATPVDIGSSGTPSFGGTFNTWMSLSTTRAFSLTDAGGGTLNYNYPISIRNANTLTVVATATYTLGVEMYVAPTCFPAGCKVLMGDGAWKNIELLQAADVVMGANGTPTVVEQVDRPILGQRKLLSFADGSLTWSEEHAMWTRDHTQSQWWWSYNKSMWVREAREGFIGGLNDNETMRTGDQAVEWAHLDGWKAQAVEVLPHPGFMSRLYLPRTAGVPIIVNGYVVGAGVNQAGFDYSSFDWSQTQATFPVVNPLPTV